MLCVVFSPKTALSMCFPVWRTAFVVRAGARVDDGGVEHQHLVLESPVIAAKECPRLRCHKHSYGV